MIYVVDSYQEICEVQDKYGDVVGLYKGMQETLHYRNHAAPSFCQLSLSPCFSVLSLV